MIEQLPTSAPAERNKDPILAILSAAFSDTSLQVRSVLEIASGFGQHVVHCAAALPIELDVLADWPDLQVDAVVVANLLHISPIATVEGLFAGARQVCRNVGLLHLYGPFKQGGRHTSTGNAEFDRSLKQRNPQWGIRDVEAVIEQARDLDWELLAQTDMPANNFSLLFQLTTS